MSANKPLHCCCTGLDVETRTINIQIQYTDTNTDTIYWCCYTGDVDGLIKTFHGTNWLFLHQYNCSSLCVSFCPCGAPVCLWLSASFWAFVSLLLPLCGYLCVFYSIFVGICVSLCLSLRVPYEESQLESALSGIRSFHWQKLGSSTNRFATQTSTSQFR